MLGFEDERWKGLEAGYRVPVDLRPVLQRLESAPDVQAAWHKLWEELYHQGDIGVGSFVAVPLGSDSSPARNDWNTYALAATIELARGKEGNPDVPAWARADYDQALRELANLGLKELASARDQETVRSILGLLAVMHGARTYGRVVVEFSEDERCWSWKRKRSARRRTPDNKALQRPALRAAAERPSRWADSAGPSAVQWRPGAHGPHNRR